MARQPARAASGLAASCSAEKDGQSAVNRFVRVERDPREQRNARIAGHQFECSTPNNAAAMMNSPAASAQRCSTDPARASPRPAPWPAVRGFAASNRRSTIRLKSIAQVRASTMHTATSRSWPANRPHVVPGSRARKAAKIANGIAKTECASLMSPAASRIHGRSAGAMETVCASTWAIGPSVDSAMADPMRLSVGPDRPLHPVPRPGVGVECHTDRTLFEFLVLEGAQAGLSWETILKKRDRYREVFAGFDATRVARFTPVRSAAALDPGIVRHRGKVEGAIANARAFLRVQRSTAPSTRICGDSWTARPW